MKMVKDNISVEELKKMSEKMFGRLVKAVVDIEQEIMVVDAPLHSDEECLLLENGSDQENLWGINIFPDQIDNEKFIVFDSMINLRPGWGNNTRGVDCTDIQAKIRIIVNRLVVK